MSPSSWQEPGTEVDPARIVWLLAGVVGAAGTLLASGRLLGPLPPLDGLANWVGVNPPLDSLAHLGRVVGLGLCAYVATVCVAALAARCSGRRRLINVVDAMTVPLLRRGLAAMAVASVAASGTFTIASATAPGTASAATAERGVATMELVEDDSATPPDTTTPEVRERGTAVMRRLDEETPRAEPSPPVGATPGPTSPGDGIVPEPDTALRSTTPPTNLTIGSGTWTIEPGDHLWHVAETTLATAWGRPPSTSETVSYLGELIETNLDELVIPGDPDLVFVGQVFSLPDPGVVTPARL